MTNVTGPQQLQTSTNISDAQPEPEFRGGTTQPFFSILEHHPIRHVDETHGYVGHVAGPYEERDEKLPNMTAAIDLVVICICILLSDYSIP